jgi:hypothetical protein
MERLIRKMIREALGDVKYESGALTKTADQLILFADNDQMTYHFALNNPDDKMAIYNYAKSRFTRLRPNHFEDDEETVMYDFLAHYETPTESENRDRVMDLFGAYYGSQVFFMKSIDKDMAKVKVKQYALDQMKDRLYDMGHAYSVVDGPSEDGFMTIVLSTKSVDQK